MIMDTLCALALVASSVKNAAALTIVLEHPRYIIAQRATPLTQRLGGSNTRVSQGSRSITSTTYLDRQTRSLQALHHSKQTHAMRKLPGETNSPSHSSNVE